jgi:SAM-dependent methyltransferase
VADRFTFDDCAGAAVAVPGHFGIGVPVDWLGKDTTMNSCWPGGPLAIGQTAELSRTVTGDDIVRFAQIGGGRYPLHDDPAAARASRFGEIIVRGGLTNAIVNAADSSPAMLCLAARRCSGYGQVELHQADATSLPLGDDSADAAISVQVLEYVADVRAALHELHRVLRPGGRIVAWDIDWATLSLHSQDEPRMRRVLQAWGGHLAHRSLPHLAGRRAGIVVEFPYFSPPPAAASVETRPNGG